MRWRYVLPMELPLAIVVSSTFIQIKGKTVATEKWAGVKTPPKAGPKIKVRPNAAKVKFFFTLPHTYITNATIRAMTALHS